MFTIGSTLAELAPIFVPPFLVTFLRLRILDHMLQAACASAVRCVGRFVARLESSTASFDGMPGGSKAAQIILVRAVRLSGEVRIYRAYGFIARKEKSP